MISFKFTFYKSDVLLLGLELRGDIGRCGERGTGRGAGYSPPEPDLHTVCPLARQLGGHSGADDLLGAAAFRCGGADLGGYAECDFLHYLREYDGGQHSRCAAVCHLPDPPAPRPGRHLDHQPLSTPVLNGDCVRGVRVVRAHRAYHARCV